MNTIGYGCKLSDPTWRNECSVGEVEFLIIVIQGATQKENIGTTNGQNSKLSNRQRLNKTIVNTLRRTVTLLHSLDVDPF